MSKGGFSAEDYTKACLDRVAERDGVVKAWAHIDPDLALQQARVLDGVQTRGPLHGMAVGIKDVILTRDMPTQSNSPIYEGFHPEIDAACVTLLRNAGAVILGKTATVELATTGHPADTRNPSALGHTPGGSSSGSAAAVADSHVALALGTQTGGSMVRPASYCGVWGVKPTWNFVSTEGVKRASTSLDTVGWFARSADDLGLLYDVFDPDGASAPQVLVIKGARLAFYRSPLWSQVEPATQTAMALVEESLRAAGAQVEVLDLPPIFGELTRAHRIIMLTEGRSGFLAEHRTQAELLHPSIRAQLENAEGFSMADLRWAHDTAAEARAIFDARTGAYDGVITPSTQGHAPEGLAATGPMTFNAMWTLLHAPCVNVPVPAGAGGLPIGVTMTGPRYADRSVLAAAKGLGGVLAGLSR